MIISVLKTGFSFYYFVLAPQAFKMYFNCLWPTEADFCPIRGHKVASSMPAKRLINERTKEGRKELK